MICAHSQQPLANWQLLHPVIRLLVTILAVSAGLVPPPPSATIECDSISNYQRGRQYCIIKNLHIPQRNSTIRYEPSIFATVKREVLFDRCRLPAIPAGLFTAFPNLRTVYTWNSGLRSLAPADFDGAHELRNIDLSLNNISALVASQFFGAIDLEYINLAENRIVALPMHTFHGLIRLRVLRIDHNRIEHLLPGTFDALPALRQLDANNNRIGSIGEQLFVRNTGLLELHLQWNCIRQVQGQPWAHLRRLESFRLQSNPVQGLEYVHVDAVHTDVRNISVRGALIGARTRHLLAGGNRIEWVQVQVAADGSHSQLERLDLEANRLRSFANLTHLPHLRRLDLSDNQLADLAVHSFAEMPLLVELRLRNSGLREIGFGLLSHKPQLRWLDVAHNQLGSIRLNRFTGLQAVRALFLEGNGLRSIELAGLRQYFPALGLVGLAQNPWNCTNLAAAIKLLEAEGIALNAVGMAREGANIKGIPCETVAAEVVAEIVVEEVVAEVATTVATEVPSESDSPAVIVTDSPVAEATAESIGGGNWVPTATTPADTVEGAELMNAADLGDMFGQLVELKVQAAQVAEAADKVADSLKRLLDVWSNTAA